MVRSSTRYLPAKAEVPMGRKALISRGVARCATSALAGRYLAPLGAVDADVGALALVGFHARLARPDLVGDRGIHKNTRGAHPGRQLTARSTRTDGQTSTAF